MPNYKLHKTPKVKKSGRVSYVTELRSERIEIHVPALLVCLLVAFVIWLYIVNFSDLTSYPPAQETTPPAEAAVTDIADAPMASAEV